MPPIAKLIAFCLQAKAHGDVGGGGRIVGHALTNLAKAWCNSWAKQDDTSFHISLLVDFIVIIKEINYNNQNGLLSEIILSLRELAPLGIDPYPLYQVCHPDANSVEPVGTIHESNKFAFRAVNESNQIKFYSV